MMESEFAHGVNIFELFKTTKPGGSGLGLPVAQQIISAHNGLINYTTEAGQGTTFKVCLPAAEPDDVSFLGSFFGVPNRNELRFGLEIP